MRWDMIKFDFILKFKQFFFLNPPKTESQPAQFTEKKETIIKKIKRK